MKMSKEIQRSNFKNRKIIQQVHFLAFQQAEDRNTFSIGVQIYLYFLAIGCLPEV